MHATGRHSVAPPLLSLLAVATSTAVLRSGPGGAREVRPRRGATGLLIRAILLAALVLGGLQGWVRLKPVPHRPEPVPVALESITAVQLTLGQAALALRDFGRGGLLSDRFDFESGIARVRRMIEALESTATEPEERQALDRAKALVDRLGVIEKEHVARADAGDGVMAADRLQEIPRLRDGAALALLEFRSVKATRSTEADADPRGGRRRRPALRVPGRAHALEPPLPGMSS